MARKWRHAKKKREEANREVLKSERAPDFLRAQWSEQVAAQTKPVARKVLFMQIDVVINLFLGQWKNAGKKAIEEAVRMRSVIDTLKARIAHLKEVACDLNESLYLMTEAQEKLPGLTKELKDKKRSLSHMERALGVEQMRTYRHLASSAFISLRMNARAMKIYLRDRLRARKFERDRVERAVRRQQYNGMCNI